MARDATGVATDVGSASVTVSSAAVGDGEPAPTAEAILRPIAFKIDGSILRLPAGTGLSNPRLNGTTLEFIQPDGTVVSVPNGAAAPLTIIVGDVEIPPATVAALLNAKGIETAAGPEVREQHASFHDLGPQSVGAGGLDFGDLLANDSGAVGPAADVSEFDDLDTSEFTLPNTRPVITSLAQSGAVIEDASYLADPAGQLTGTETAVGVIRFVDTDIGDSHTVTVGAVPTGYRGTFTPVLTAGQVDWSFAVDDADIQYLAAGEVITQVYTVIITDAGGASASQNLVITLTGTNDIPLPQYDVIESTEDVATTASTRETGVLANDSDTDATDTPQLTVSAILAGTSGAASAVVGTDATVVHGSFGDLSIKADGTYLYTPSSAEAQKLAAGTTASDTFTYTVIDPLGATATATLKFNITGANDLAVFGGTVSGSVTEDASAALGSNLVINPGFDEGGADWLFANAYPTNEDGNSLAYGIFSTGGTVSQAISTTSGRAYSGSFEGRAYHYFDGPESITLRVDGVVVATFAPPAEGVTQFNFEFVATGPTSTIEFGLDAPGGFVIIDNVSLRTATSATPGFEHFTGTLTFTDIDVETHTVSVATTPTDYVGTFTPTIVQDSSNGSAGQIDWHYAVADSDLAWLAKDQTVVQTYTIVLSDGSSKDVSITLHGVNDAPVTDGVNASGDEDQTTIVTLHGTDVDGSVSSFTIASLARQGTLYQDAELTELVKVGDTFTAIGNSATLYFKPDLDWHGSTSFQYSATDDLGTTDRTSALMTITVNSVNDAPTGTDATIAINGDYSYALTAKQFGFGDADGDAMAGVYITGLPARGVLTDTVTGQPVVVGDYFTVADLANMRLTYTPVESEMGTNYASFAFQVRDTGGVAHDGVDTDQTDNSLTFTVTAPNSAPVFGLGDTSADITEDKSATVTEIDRGSIAFTDADVGSSHTVSSAPKGVAALGSFEAHLKTDGSGTATGEIEWSFTAANGELQSLAAGEVVTQTYTITLDDGDPTSGKVTRDVTVTIHGVDDAPTLSEFTDYTYKTAQEDIGEWYGVVGETLYLSTGFDVADVDHGSDADGVTASGAFVSATAAGGATVSSELLAALQTAGDFGYIGFYGAYVQAFISNALVQYLHDGQSVTATYNLTVTDALGASTTQPVTFTIYGTNDVPETSATSVTGNEDQTIMVALSGSDIDGTVSSFVITSLAQNGKLFGDVALTQELAVGSTVTASGGVGYAYFRPTAEWSGGTSFKFAATDNSGATDATPSTANITVLSANDAPHGTDATIKLTAGNSYALAAADFGFGDSDGNSFAGVVIATLPTHGTLTDANTGNSVSAGDYFTAADLVAHRLVFTPASGETGAAYTSIGLQVRDNGGTANGGTDTDPTANSITFNVVPPNAAPTIISADLSGEVTEDDSYVLNANLLTNGGFETHLGINFPGWTITAPAGTTYNNTGSHHGGVVGALLDSNGLTSAHMTLSQSIQTIAGVTYTIDFWALNSFGNPNSLDVKWNGASVGNWINVTPSGSNGGPFNHYSINVTGTGGLTELQFDVTNKTYWTIDDVSVSVAKTPGSEPDSGVITFTDANPDNTHTVSVTPPAGMPYGTFTATLIADSTNGTTGTVRWNFVVNDAAIQSLGVNDVLTQTYTVTIDDGEPGGKTSRDVVVEIHGTNDAPVLTQGEIDMRSATEDSDAYLYTGASFHVSDIDGDTAFTTSAVLVNATGTAGAQVSSALLQALQSSFSTGYVNGYGALIESDLDNSLLQYLGTGQTITANYRLTVSDTHGGSVEQIVSFTYRGVDEIQNAVPTITSSVWTVSVTEDASLSQLTPELIVRGGFEPNSGGPFVGWNVIVPTGAAAGLAGEPHSGGNNALFQSYYSSLPVQLTQDVAVVAGQRYTLSYWLFNSHGSNNAFTAMWDGREIQAIANQVGAGNYNQGNYVKYTFDVVGDADGTSRLEFDFTNKSAYWLLDDVSLKAAVTSGTEARSGLINFSDANISDVHSVSFVPVASDYKGTFSATLSNDSTGDGSGYVTWNYAATDAELQSLAAGQVIKQYYDVTIRDNFSPTNGTVTQRVEVDLVGVNDAPRAVNDTYAGVAASAPAGLATWDYNAANGHYYKVVLGSVTWTEARAAAEAAGGYLATVTTDAENEFIDWIASGTFTYIDGSLVTPDGVWLGGADALSEGQWRWVTGPEAGQLFTYTHWLGGQPNNGGTGGNEDWLAFKVYTPNAVTWNDTGNAPTSTNGHWGYVIEYGGVMPSYEDRITTISSATLLTNDTDVDVGDTLSVVGLGASNGLSATSAKGAIVTLDTITGLVSYDPVNASGVRVVTYGQTISDTFTYWVSDGHGGSSSATVTMTITGVADNVAPVITAVSTAVVSTGSLISNGGFDSDLVGWTQSGDSSANFIGSPVHGGAGTFQTGPVNPGTLSQVLSTVAGQTYVLSFWLRGNGGAGPTFDAMWNGQKVLALTTADQGYTKYSFEVTATAATSTLSFGFKNAPGYWYLDDVSVIKAGGNYSQNGSVSFLDANYTDIHSASAAATRTGYVGTFSVDAAATESGGAGSIKWRFTASDAEIAQLAYGTTTQTYAITIADGRGGTVLQNISVDVVRKSAPTDISWEAIVPSGTNYPSANGAMWGTLSTTDADSTSGFSYRVLTSSSGFFASGDQVSNTVTTDAGPQVVEIRVTDASGETFDETFGIYIDNGNGSNGTTFTGTSRDDIFYARGGNDTINAGGGNDTVFGQDGNDTINGQAGNDTLRGGNGTDTIDGGAGADNLTGGPGADTFRFSSGQSSVATITSAIVKGYDVITDFDPSTDKIDFATAPIVAPPVTLRDGTDVTVGGATITHHTITNGIVTFYNAGTLVALNSAARFAAAISYLESQPTATDLGNAGAVVAFVTTFDGTSHTFLYQQVGNAPNAANDLLIDLGTASVTSVSSLISAGRIDPIILDLDHNGFDLSGAAHFDLDHDGLPDHLGWPGTGDGLLVADLDHSGAIESGHEVFSPDFSTGGHANSLAALSTYDSNGDGRITIEDADFADLLIWQDFDRNGTSNASELLSLTDHGIVEIDLGANEVDLFEDGQHVFVEGTFIMSDGSTREFIGVDLGAPSEAAPPGSNEVAALLPYLDPQELIADYDFTGGDTIDLAVLLNNLTADDQVDHASDAGSELNGIVDDASASNDIAATTSAGNHLTLVIDNGFEVIVDQT